MPAPELIHSIIALTQEFNSELRSLRKKNEFIYHYWDSWSVGVQAEEDSNSIG